MELSQIQNKIYNIRGQQVMLDYDLAEMYEVENKRLKEQVRRNIERFPEDFMFELNRDEYNSLRSQIATLENEGRGKYSKYLPYAFTQNGVAMLSSVLRSPVAIQVNIKIMRAFTAIRNYLVNAGGNSLVDDIYQKIIKLEKEFREHVQDWEEESYENEKKFDELYMALTEMAAKQQLANYKTPRQPIGYIKPKDKSEE